MGAGFPGSAAPPLCVGSGTPWGCAYDSSCDILGFSFDNNSRSGLDIHAGGELGKFLKTRSDIAYDRDIEYDDSDIGPTNYNNVATERYNISSVKCMNNEQVLTRPSGNDNETNTAVVMQTFK